MFKYFSSTT